MAAQQVQATCILAKDRDRRVEVSNENHVKIVRQKAMPWQEWLRPYSSLKAINDGADLEGEWEPG